MSEQGLRALFSLEGRTAAVTGGNRGIGSGISRALAQAGADVVSIHRNSERPAIAAEIEALGRRFHAINADLGEIEKLDSLAQSVIESYGPIDILVNNAGPQYRQPAADFPLTEWQRLLDVHLTAAFVLCQSFGRAMLERGHGHIVNIASLLSFQGGITVPAYAAAKSGLAGLTRALANEWAGRGVHVNAVAPGYVATDLNEALLANDARREQINVRIPAGRWGSPEDIAGPVVFLCTPAASWIHGEVLVVDGGWMGR